MITLELFKEIIDAMHKQEEKEHKFADAMEDMLDGRFVPQLSVDLHTVLMKLLREAFDDRCDWLSYWVYDMDFGANDKMVTSMSTDGKEESIELDTVEKMYDFLIENKKGWEVANV